MADDRPRGHAAVGSGEEIHDDDELAAALAAELERIAPTGAVPVLRASAVPFGPVAAPSAPVAAPSAPVAASSAPLAASSAPLAASSAPAAASSAPVAAPRGSGTGPLPPREAPADEPPYEGRPEAMAPRAARPSLAAGASGPQEADGHAMQEHHRHAETSRHGARRAGRAPVTVAAGNGIPDTRPSRAPAFSTTGEHRPGRPPAGRRRAADAVIEPPTTQPVVLPSAEIEVPGVESSPPVVARGTDAPPVEAPRAAEPSPAGPLLPGALRDPLHETGPLALPPTLYESWERSLRSIGRPRRGAEPELDVAEHGDEDAPTVALSRASLGPLPEPPPRAVPAPGAVEDAAPSRRRRGRNRTVPPQQPTAEAAPPAGVTAASVAPAAVPAPEPEPEPVPAAVAVAVPSLARSAGPDEDDEGVDEEDTAIRAVSAADTAAVPLPPMVEPASPVTGTVPVVGEGGAAPDRHVPLGGPGLLAVLLIWCGAFASPVLLLIGFGLAGIGAGGVAAGAMVLGVAVAVPAALRLTAAAEADRVGSPALAARLFGPRGGTTAAAVLLAARLLAAALALLAVGGLASGFVARTGVGGASAASASVGAMAVAGLGAVAATVWPRRVTRIVLGVLSAAALVVTLLVLIVTAPAVTVTVAAPPPAGSALLAGTTGFAVLGLVLAITAADTTRTATGRARARGAALGVALAAVAGLVVLVLALAVGRGAGVVADPATSFADVLAGATPAAVAAPLGVLLLIAALPLPALLVATAGETAAVLIGAGRSSRLGAVAAGLLALALALVLLASGADAASALATIGPVLGVPAAVWTGIATFAPLRRASVRSAAAVTSTAAAVSTVIGWLLVDGLLSTGERSPVLDLLGSARDAAWRGSPAVGLFVAFVLGLVTAGIGRLASQRAAAPPVSRLRSGGRQPVDSVDG